MARLHRGCLSCATWDWVEQGIGAARRSILYLLVPTEKIKFIFKIFLLLIPLLLLTPSVSRTSSPISHFHFTASFFQLGSKFGPSKQQWRTGLEERKTRKKETWRHRSEWSEQEKKKNCDPKNKILAGRKNWIVSRCPKRRRERIQ